MLTTKSGHRSRVHISRDDGSDRVLCGHGEEEWSWEVPDDTPDREIPALCLRCARLRSKEGT